MTSIEWLKEKLFNDFGFAFSDNIFEQAKEMHKQEIIDAFKKGQALGFDDNPNYMAEQYYNQTYEKQNVLESIP